jgi:excisionase family DNA binding protein
VADVTAADRAEIRRLVAEVVAELRPSYLTLEEAGALIRHEAETIRRWIWEGRLTAYKPGKHPLVKEAELLALVEANETRAKRVAKRKAGA